MNRIKKIITVGVTLASIGSTTLLSSIAAADTCTTYCTHKCNHGYHTFDDVYLKSSNGNKQGKKYFYIDTNSINTTKVPNVTSGVSEWMTISYIRNYVDLVKTTSKSNAQIIIKMDSFSSGINGITYTYKKSSGRKFTDVPLSNYEKAEVILNDTLSVSDIRKVTMHEVGHALGLSHAHCKKNTIMYPASDNAAIAMTSFDRANLRHIYC